MPDLNRLYREGWWDAGERRWRLDGEDDGHGGTACYVAHEGPCPSGG
jgi:hypothetical protein